MSEQKKVIPSDVAEVVNVLSGMRDELPDAFWQEIKEYIHELVHDARAWRAGTAQEPDWDAFRVIIDDACAYDGMPRLFGVS